MNNCGRHEYKHYINLADYYLLKTKLRSLMKIDSNANSNGKYFIRSLYFDDDCDKVLLEKLNGVDNRDKYRIRIYNKNDNVIHFEKKSKQIANIIQLGNRRSLSVSKYALCRMYG